ncbi:MAG: hypothetical protein AAF386_11195, partial [Pseudomonadota bacterium]
DVLSSIRRLVAENAKAAQEKDALVLTPNHRVKSSMTPAAQTAQTIPPAPVATDPAPVVGVTATGAVRVGPATADATASDGRAEPTLTRPEPAASNVPPISAIAAGQPGTPVAPAPSVPTQGRVPKVSLAVPTESTDATVAPAAAFQTVRPTAQSSADKPVAADPAAGTTAPKATAQADTAQAQTPVQQTPPAIPPAPPMQADPAPAATAQAAPLDEAAMEAIETAAIENTISEIESKLGADHGGWETDDVFATENDVTPVAPVSGPLAEHMDKTALKALVSELLQDELRGPLGEKITRNVRKLVRREIQRAFTAQRLD